MRMQASRPRSRRSSPAHAELHRRAGPATLGAQRARARAADPDGHRPALRSAAQGARPRRRGKEPIRFNSAILPAYLRRTRNIEELLPWLYLKGVSTGQFAEALAALLGPEAPGLSATTVRRLTESWQEEHEHWQKRDLSARRYVYLWADGVYFIPRLEHERQCMLVLSGADGLGRRSFSRSGRWRDSAK